MGPSNETMRQQLQTEVLEVFVMACKDEWGIEGTQNGAQV